jgi:hypothetical protein
MLSSSTTRCISIFIGGFVSNEPWIIELASLVLRPVQCVMPSISNCNPHIFSDRYISRRNIHSNRSLNSKTSFRAKRISSVSCIFETDYQKDEIIDFISNVVFVFSHFIKNELSYPDLFVRHPCFRFLIYFEDKRFIIFVFLIVEHLCAT